MPTHGAGDRVKSLMRMRRVGYLRVSTAEQRPDRQIDGLKTLCDELHVETVSAVGRRRPVYERAIRRLRHGDMFVVWDIDRAFRSTRDALNELDALHRRGVEFLIANLRIDTTTPEGYYVYTVLSANAELERRTLSRRTREGLAAARLRGARLGRPPKLSEEQLVEARARLAEGCETVSAVAADYKVAPWTLTRALRREETAKATG